MDLEKLIMTGKHTMEMKLGDFMFHLETPEALQGIGIQNNIELATVMIVKITNTVTNESEDFVSPEQKKKLSERLGKMQGGVMTWLTDRCAELANQQQKDIEDLSKK